MTTRPSTVNVKSRLLTDEQNEAIFHALGNKCRTSATTVAELHRAADAKKQIWERQYSGVVCCVKDFVKRSYFIRFYEGKDNKMVWEHDIRKYLSFEFTTSDGHIVLTVQDHKLVFTDKDEAKNLQKKTEEVVGKLKERRARRQDVRSKYPAPPGENTTANIPTRKSSDKKTKKVSKEDIGIPTQFRHVNRVSWDPDTGLDMKKLDPDMRALFEKIGINEQSQVDKETLDFIYDFIEQHGGAKAVNNDVQKGEPKTKSRIRPPPPPFRGTAPPPPPPNRSWAVPPPPPSDTRRVIPPPPPSSNRYQPPSAGRKFAPPPRTPTNRNQSQQAQPDKKWTGPPPPPPSTRQTGVPPPPPPTRDTGVPPPPPPARQTGVPPPPPPTRDTGVPPPPPPARQTGVPPPPPPTRETGVPPPPPPAKTQAGPPPPPSSSASADTSSKDFVGAAAGGDNPLKQQIMQLLLHNPDEITDFIYDIVDKRGGLGFIKDNLAERNSPTDPSKQNEQESETGFTDNRDDGKDPSDDQVTERSSSSDNQVPGRSSSEDQVPGRSSSEDQVPGRSSSEDQVPGRSFTADEVPGRRSDNVSGATAQRLSDLELSSDVFDDDDDEWNELADQIDQY